MSVVETSGMKKKWQRTNDWDPAGRSKLSIEKINCHALFGALWDLGELTTALTETAARTSPAAN